MYAMPGTALRRPQTRTRSTPSVHLQMRQPGAGVGALLGGHRSHRRAHSYGDCHVPNREQRARVSTRHHQDDARSARHDDTECGA